MNTSNCGILTKWLIKIYLFTHHRINIEIGPRPLNSGLKNRLEIIQAYILPLYLVIVIETHRLAAVGYVKGVHPSNVLTVTS